MPIILDHDNISNNDRRKMANYKNRLLHELGKIKLVANKVGRPYTLNSAINRSAGVGDVNYIKVRMSHEDFSNSWRKNASNNNWNDENKHLSNTKVNGPRKRAAATMLLNVLPQYHSQDKPDLHYVLGKTRPAFRERGLGMALGGIIAKAAADAGFDTARQYSVQYNKTQYRTPNNRPISGIMASKLGSTHTAGFGRETHQLNLRKSNVLNKIKRVHNHFVLYRNN